MTDIIHQQVNGRNFPTLMSEPNIVAAESIFQ